jgi:hypothetical protein
MGIGNPRYEMLVGLLLNRKEIEAVPVGKVCMLYHPDNEMKRSAEDGILLAWCTDTGPAPAGLRIDGPARGANGAPQCGPGPGVLLACRIGSGRPSPGLDV